MAPLHALQKGKSKPSDVIHWTKEHDKAFTDLKQRLCTALVLGLPDMTKSFHIHTDTHEKTLGRVIAQEHGGKVCLITYYSPIKSPVEQGFDPCIQQILAVHWMLTVTEPIVGFQPVVVHTMHTPVQLLLQGRIKGVSSAGTPVKNYDVIAAIWLVIQNRRNPISIVKVCGHITRNPNEHEQNNIVEKLAKLAALRREECQVEDKQVHNINAIQTHS